MWGKARGAVDAAGKGGSGWGPEREPVCIGALSGGKGSEGKEAGRSRKEPEDLRPILKVFAGRYLPGSGRSPAGGKRGLNTK